VSLQRGVDGPDPIRREPVARYDGSYELRRSHRGWRLGAGTLACPHCDAPVGLPGPASPADALACPFCGHAGALRDFLSLAAPTRPAHVEIRVVARRT
jgi:hypothetical protein